MSARDGGTASSGFTLLELLLALTVALMLFVAVLAAYSQGRAIQTAVEGAATIQGNVRIAMDRMERDVRMAGFGVPAGQRIGGTDLWTPVVFHAAPTELGLRAELDGGRTEVTCTPSSTNSACPLTKLRLDSIDYYQRLNCAPPDGASGNLELVAVAADGRWKALTCSGFNATESSISVSTVANGDFAAGTSHAATIEQVYLRYDPATASPYGRLLRAVRYDNMPSGTFPPTGLTWQVVADHLTGFWLEYRDAAGTLLTGNPLSAANCAAIDRVVVSVEGYDLVGPQGRPQLIESRSEILVRN